MPTLRALPAAALELLARPTVASVTTINRNGTPQWTSVHFMRVGDERPSSTRSDRVKAQNLRRDPRLTFAVVDFSTTQRAVIISGTATVGAEGVWKYMETNARREVRRSSQGLR